MGIIRPATPGFIATLTATILLAVVSFCVPYFKSVYFLKADISVDNHNGSITFGTLGYCLELNNGTSCSKPSVGYQLDINSLVDLPFDIDVPQVVVKWITYALVLHIVALALAAGSAVFGLLAHVREMSMACCSTCVSGFAAFVALLAFIFDIALFFIAKARLNSVGKASIGNAVWLTLAAWILLFFSGCFYTLGRCCISKRSPRSNFTKNQNDPEHNGYADQMRLDAVKAEADRKAKQSKGELGLPAFHEVQPLTGRVDGDHVYTSKYEDNHPSSPTSPTYGGRPSGNGNYAGGGYVRAAEGTSAMDGYYNNDSRQEHNAYPPRRQGSGHTYASDYTYATQPQVTSPPPVPPGNLYNAAPAQTSPPAQNMYGPAVGAAALAVPGGRDYGHEAGGTSYHSANSGHQQYPTGYSQYDQGQGYNPYDQQPNRQVSYHDPYSQPTSPPQAPPQTSSYFPGPMATAGPAGTSPHPYLPTPSPSHTMPQAQQPDRSYTLGGDGYGMNSVPPLPEHSSPVGQGPSQAFYEEQRHTSPPPRILSPGRQYDEQPPPGYDAGTSANVHVPAWGQKS